MCLGEGVSRNMHSRYEFKYGLSWIKYVHYFQKTKHKAKSCAYEIRKV